MKKSHDSIFISIASYKDQELIPTILDCVNKAHKKQRLFFGICLQDNIREYFKLKHLKKKHKLKMQIHFVSPNDSQGTCWARHIIQKKLYRGQKYYLQIDSHHRFLEQWDSVLEHILNKKTSEGINKPIITSYCPPYQNNICDQYSTQMCSFDMFDADGDLKFRSFILKDKDIKNISTIPARFLSGHFIFTLGLFCKECLYDPMLYFRGEELALSARAYTHGYEFFHPTIPIIWHYYLRINNDRHWDQHSIEKGFVYDHKARDNKSKQRIRSLLGMDALKINFGHYGLGNKKTLHEYELFSGLNFKQKQIHKNCSYPNYKSPWPYMMSENDWASNMLQKKIIQIIFPKTLDSLKIGLKYMKIQIFSHKYTHLYEDTISANFVSNIIKNNYTWKKLAGISDLPKYAKIFLVYKNENLNQTIKIHDIAAYDA